MRQVLAIVLLVLVQATLACAGGKDRLTLPPERTAGHSILQSLPEMVEMTEEEKKQNQEATRVLVGRVVDRALSVNASAIELKHEGPTAEEYESQIQSLLATISSLQSQVGSQDRGQASSASLVQWVVPAEATLFGKFSEGVYETTFGEFRALVERPGEGVIPDPDVIYAGETLFIPVSSSTAVSVSEASEQGTRHEEDLSRAQITELSEDTNTTTTATYESGTVETLAEASLIEPWTETSANELQTSDDSVLVLPLEDKYSQNFWKAVMIALLVILFLVLLADLAWLHVERKQLRRQVDLLETKIDERDRKLSSMTDTVSLKTAQIRELEKAVEQVAELTLSPDFVDSSLVGDLRMRIWFPKFGDKVLMPCSRDKNDLVLVAESTTRASRGIKGHLSKCEDCRKILKIDHKPKPPRKAKAIPTSG